MKIVGVCWAKGEGQSLEPCKGSVMQEGRARGGGSGGRLAGAALHGLAGGPGFVLSNLCMASPGGNKRSPFWLNKGVGHTS